MRKLAKIASLVLATATAVMWVAVAIGTGSDAPTTHYSTEYCAYVATQAALTGPPECSDKR